MEAGAGVAEAANGGIDSSTDLSSGGGTGSCLSVHRIAGGGKAADIILWRRGRVTVGVIFGATVAWWLFEKSGLSFLTVCSDVLLILIVVQFTRVKVTGLLNKQPRPLPELVLSEEMVSNTAASFRVKVNNMLMIAHDITLGKDFRRFFQEPLLWSQYLHYTVSTRSTLIGMLAWSTGIYQGITRSSMKM
ncbi:hypothetical protein GUJ93_ZPchr0013g34781 [Zizania palustris]|uniref:Reticulon-like protein n=1 Tax=Zizania palustris TaxID=103762 RepID=A0A8J5WV67_ZIZPA|nr:hypothetical protein GUJ93_ZPchr0013g34781 [Zizania palustris]